MDTKRFFDKLCESGIEFFTGVPDSLLKDFGNCLYEKLPKGQHIIAANEGNAIALAAGSYIATGKISIVYLQNSGLGNTINPLLSMADKKLYAIPMIIIIGWRGQGKDAEQHLVQGRLTPKLIETMGYPNVVLSHDEKEAYVQIDTAMTELHDNPQPYFIVVEEGTFDSYPLSREHRPLPAGDMSREAALHMIAQYLSSDYFVVTTTGKTSREWYEVREQLDQKHTQDFLTVGSMGHTSSIALGMALRSKKNILCIDGDGSMLMHMGSLVVAGNAQCENFKYVLINNFSHESVGGLPTPLDHVDFDGLFRAFGFTRYYRADNLSELETQIAVFMQASGAVLEIRVKQGSRSDLARPDMSAGELAKMLRKQFDI